MRKKALLCVMIIALVLALWSSLAYADSYDTTTAQATVNNAVHDGTNTIYNIALAIVLPVAAVVVGWAGVQVLFNGEKGMEQAKKILFRVTLAIMAVYIAPTIIVGIEHLVHNNNYALATSWTIGG